MGNFILNVVDSSAGGPGMLKYDLMAFPPPDASQTPVATGGIAIMFSIPVGAKNPEAAAEVLRYLTNEEGRAKLVGLDFIPASEADSSSNPSELYGKMLGFQSTARTRAIFTPATYAALTNGIQGLFAGSKTPADIAADMVAAGPPAFLITWDRTRGSAGIKGVAAMTSIPMYLNTRAPHLKSIRDLKDGDKIAVTAVKVSIPAIILQMAAIKEFGRNEWASLDKYTVSLTHPDALISLLSDRTEVTAHFTSPPFHQKERKSPNIRTIMTSDDAIGGPSTFTMLYTTSKFHDANPKVYAAFLAAFTEAMRLINADKKAAAETFIALEGQGMKLDEVMEVLDDKDVRFTTSPEAMMKYAEFMHGVGTLKVKPADWKELFFPEIHGAGGN